VNISEITPLILTYNEEPNLRETLLRLHWAKQVIVVDSFSDDETLGIAKEFENVLVFQRKFDHFADQCNFGLTKVDTSWVLSIDADYHCDVGLSKELNDLEGKFNAYKSEFVYCVFGKPLRETLYPDRTVLYKKTSAVYQRDGHAHKVEIAGPFGKLKSLISHDDRKSLHRWLTAQDTYADLELSKLLDTPIGDLGWKDRIRLWVVVAPFLVLVYCLFYKLLILDGWAGIYYSLQRFIAELFLSLKLVDHRLRNAIKKDEDA
jgi:glycosyltransferase involved in cell wall biosynthesis